jgi:hypothetical protein
MSEGWPRYSRGGGRQKPGPVGGQNPVEGGGSHVGCASDAVHHPLGIGGA